MKINFKNGYYKKGVDGQGNPVSRLVYVYTVSGTAEEIADYKAVNGEMCIIDEVSKLPLFFTTTAVPNGISLRKSTDGTRFTADTMALKMFRDMEVQFGTTQAREAAAAMKQPEPEEEPEPEPAGQPATTSTRPAATARPRK